MKIAIVIPTYYRPDGRTRYYLTRALNSIQAQTYKDYEVYVIGDKYEPLDELVDIVKDFENITWLNLDEAKERDKYPFNSYELWCAGGCNAINTGIQAALNDGLSYVCLLGHDDYFKENHLDEVQKAILQGYDFICSYATHPVYNILPTCDAGEFKPEPCKLVSSSICFNFRNSDLRFRDVFDWTGTPYPSDADFISRYNGIGYLIDKLTVIHDEEGYAR